MSKIIGPDGLIIIDLSAKSRLRGGIMNGKSIRTVRRTLLLKYKKIKENI